MSDVLAVGAHPDDIEIFAGGTLASLSRRGWSVHLLHLTRGEKGTRGSAELRFEEATRSANELGATMEILDLGDGHLRDTDDRRDAIIDVIRREKPKLLLGPHPSDDHPDHAATGELVKSTWYLAGITRTGDPARPPHRPDRLWFYASHEHFDPNLIVKLEPEDVERLEKSVQCYGSQFHSSASAEPETRLTRPGYLDSIVGRRRFFGARIDADYGEAFRSHGPVAILDPTRLFE